MRDILEISTPSLRNQLCKGIGRLLDSEDDVGSDFEFLCADSAPIKAHFFVLQIFCRALQNSNCRRICFESLEVQREDVRCLLEFIYRGKTQIQRNRLDAVKGAAAKLSLETFLDLVDRILVKSVEEEVTIKNETDTENEQEVCESLAEEEDNVREEDEDSSDRDYTECSEEEEEQKTNVGKDKENGGIKKHLASKKYDLRSYQSGNLNAHLPTKHQMDSNSQVLEKRVKCNQCGYTCATKLVLKTHMKNAHCATNKGELKRRKLSIQSNARDHVCKTCGKCFQTAKCLRQHKMVHAKKVDCGICGKKLSLRSIYYHRNTHEVGENRKFKCTICAYRSTVKFNVEIHLKNVHHMSKGKIARLIYSKATRVSDEDLGKIRRSFKGRKNCQPKH